MYSIHLGAERCLEDGCIVYPTFTFLQMFRAVAVDMFVMTLVIFEFLGARSKGYCSVYCSKMSLALYSICIIIPARNSTPVMFNGKKSLN